MALTVTVVTCYMYIDFCSRFLNTDTAIIIVEFTIGVTRHGNLERIEKNWRVSIVDHKTHNSAKAFDSFSISNKYRNATQRWHAHAPLTSRPAVSSLCNLPHPEQPFLAEALLIDGTRVDTLISNSN